MTRLTQVQQDIIDRMRDGWALHGTYPHYELRKDGEPSRHVAPVTVDSLVGRELLRRSYPVWVWTLS